MQVENDANCNELTVDGISTSVRFVAFAKHCEEIVKKLDEAFIVIKSTEDSVYGPSVIYKIPSSE
jgi:hypothetical protein